MFAGSQGEWIGNHPKEGLCVDFRPKVLWIVRAATYADQHIIATLSQKLVAVSVHKGSAELRA